MKEPCSVICIQDFPGQESLINIGEDARSAIGGVSSSLFGKNGVSTCPVSNC